MRKLLNVLYVTTPNAYISKDGLNVVISVNQSEIFRIPIINIEGIATFGYMGISPGIMKLCADYKVSICFLSPHGRFISRIQGPTEGNVLLRKMQYQLSEDNTFALNLSRIFIAGKVQNYRNILRRFIRDNGSQSNIELVANSLDHCKRKILQAVDFNQLRGLEGDAANHYFSIFSNLILQQNDDFIFAGRNRRPPKDPINVLLSFIYTLLANEVSAALETVGLDPYVGYLHTIRPGRTSLSLDLMEELRAYLGDRLVLTLINRRQIGIKDFISQGENGMILTDNGRKIVISAWQNRKKEMIIHPFLKEKMPIGLLPHVQAMLLARYIRGSIDNYPVFLIQ